MRYFTLRKKVLNKTKREVCETYPKVCDYVKEAKLGHEISENNIVVIGLDNLPAFITDENWSEFIPTLILAKKVGPEGFHMAEVDEGAVKHLLNGANVMAPGITYVSSFSEGDVVVVWSPNREAPLVVGKALMSSEKIMETRKGKAIKTIHYAGDKIWNLCLTYLKQIRK